jgi:hypothetical protein
MDSIISIEPHIQGVSRVGSDAHVPAIAADISMKLFAPLRDCCPQREARSDAQASILKSKNHVVASKTGFIVDI